MKLAFILLAALWELTNAGFLQKRVTKKEAENNLEMLDYLPYHHDSTIKAMIASENDQVQNDIKDFSQVSQLTMTGELDTNTRSKMSEPRCGVPDILAISYRLPARWKKQNITYMIGNYPKDLERDTVKQAIKEGFDAWSAVTPLTFSLVQSGGDVFIKFVSGYHGDDDAFDGENGVLAHASKPNSKANYIHFDYDEKWTYRDADKLAIPGHFDLLSVATHEVGHLLGLDHAVTNDAIMKASYYDPRDADGNYVTPALQEDDIQRIQSFYPYDGTANCLDRSASCQLKKDRCSERKVQRNCAKTCGLCTE